MKGFREGEAGSPRERAVERKERAGQEGRVWPSVSVKDNKGGLKRV